MKLSGDMAATSLTTEHGANAALAMCCLAARGKDDPSEGFIYNPLPRQLRFFFTTGERMSH
jgi:hypothetical protein